MRLKIVVLKDPERTEGTYSKYASLDDQIDGFHYYTSFIKYGLGRAQWMRHKRLGTKNHQRGRCGLVKKYDGEFPSKYFEKYLSTWIFLKKFFGIVLTMRDPSFMDKKNNQWVLKIRSNELVLNALTKFIFNYICKS